MTDKPRCHQCKCFLPHHGQTCDLVGMDCRRRSFIPVPCKNGDTRYVWGTTHWEERVAKEPRASDRGVKW